MKLHPNPPRTITVVVAVVLLVVGVILAWPVEPLVSMLAPAAGTLTQYGIALDAQTGYLCLFLSSVLMIAGSLLPFI